MAELEVRASKNLPLARDTDDLEELHRLATADPKPEDLPCHNDGNGPVQTAEAVDDTEKAVAHRAARKR